MIQHRHEKRVTSKNTKHDSSEVNFTANHRVPNKLETSFISLQHFLLPFPRNRVLLLLHLCIPAPGPKVLHIREGLVLVRRHRVGHGIGSGPGSVPFGLRTLVAGQRALGAPAGGDEPDGDQALAHVVVHGHQDDRG